MTGLGSFLGFVLNIFLTVRIFNQLDFRTRENA